MAATGAASTHCSSGLTWSMWCQEGPIPLSCSGACIVALTFAIPLSAPTASSDIRSVSRFSFLINSLSQNWNFLLCQEEDHIIRCNIMLIQFQYRVKKIIWFCLQSGWACVLIRVFIHFGVLTGEVWIIHLNSAILENRNLLRAPLCCASYCHCDNHCHLIVSLFQVWL